MTAVSTKNTLSAADWEVLFGSWSKGPSQTEQEKCENAERMIRSAISLYEPLKYRTIKVFVQGSYRNRTNVRADSDVDVCVLCLDSFYPNYSHTPNVNSDILRFSDSTYGFTELKHDVEAALVAKFSRQAVTRGDKAFDVKENTYRVAADVVPTFEGRLYYYTPTGLLTYHSGTVLQCSGDGSRIHNWPEQHYANGVSKHTETARQFKKKARCLKTLCNSMAASGVTSAKEMSSFLLESLVYNCPNSVFTHATHYDDMKAVISSCWGMTKTDDSATNMLEVNDIKYLFRPSQPWDRSTTHQFLFDAWGYVGFE